MLQNTYHKICILYLDSENPEWKMMTIMKQHGLEILCAKTIHLVSSVFVFALLPTSSWSPTHKVVY